MSNSIEFNSVDLSTYNLVVNSAKTNRQAQDLNFVRLHDRAYAFPSGKQPKIISLEVSVTGTSRSNLDSNLDDIKLALVTEVSKVLKRDALSGRYWNALLQLLEGNYYSATLWRGLIIFHCADPLAYANTQTSSDHDIDADPDTVIETPGGTSYIEPVYTLTAGEDLTDITLKVENIDTGEELIWEGSLDDTKELEINLPLWIVKKEGVADMDDVSGQFPRLKPAQDNHIKVTDFGSLGALNITYRDTYL